MNPKTLALIILIGGVLLLLADLASGTPSSHRGSVSIAGAILISGALIALSIRGKQSRG